MRKMMLSELTPIVVLLGLTFFVIIYIQMSARPQMWLYPLVRQVARTKIDYQTRDMLVHETPHFVVKYTMEDSAIVTMVAQAAEEAYEPVTKAVGFWPEGKALIVIYPDKRELRKAFSWSGEQSAMGVYWSGVIQVLSPRTWLKDVNSAEEFINNGPMAHEFTHLVFDYLAQGNYPRWFTEGLAQYVEYRMNGYEWLTPGNILTKQLYTMAELDNSFDELTNQSLAYRESLAAVRYIAEVHGEDKLQQVLKDLQAGHTMKTAISKNINMDYTAYETAWKDWAIHNMAY